MDTYRFSDSEMFQIITIWKQIAEEKDGIFKKILSTSPAFIDPTNSELQRFELYIPNIEDTHIKLSTSEKHPLKVEYKFYKDLDLTFHIYPEDIIEKLAKIFGSKDVKIGNDVFDDQFILKSDNDSFMHYLLDEESIQYLQKVIISSINLNNDPCSELQIVLAIPEIDKNELLKLIGFVEHMIFRIYEWDANHCR